MSRVAGKKKQALINIDSSGRLCKNKKTMKKLLNLAVFLIISFVLFAPSALRAETQIKADVDKKSLTTDEMLTYKIVITSSERNVPAPSVPEFKGFNLLSNAQSSTISFAKGSIKTILVYAFVLAPVEAGKLKIKPASVQVKDKTYTSEEIEVEVAKGTAQPRPDQKPPKPKPPLPEEAGQITI